MIEDLGDTWEEAKDELKDKLIEVAEREGLDKTKIEN